MIILTNAFSINMLKADATIKFAMISLKEFKDIIAGEKIINAIGHPATDALVREIAGVNLPPGERITVLLEEGDVMVVAQYSGPRLTEGTTILPPGAVITWWRVEIV